MDTPSDEEFDCSNPPEPSSTCFGGLAVLHCPFQDVARVHPAVCGVFLTTLVRALHGEVPVEHVPGVAGPEAGLRSY
jgi:hypothetical protein